MATEVDIRPDKASFKALERALRDGADGREFLADLDKSWRAAGEVAARDAKRSARMIAAPRSRHSVSLRQAIAAGVKVETSMGVTKSGRGRSAQFSAKGNASVAVVWKRSAMKKATRGRFRRPQSILWQAGWLLNKGRMWSHPVFGLGPNVTTGIPQAKGWFDDSVLPHLPGMALAAGQAYEELVDRIERRSL